MVTTASEIVTVPVLNVPDVIHLGSGLASHIAQDVTKAVPASTYVIVTDTSLAKLHLTALLAAFETQLGKTQRLLTRVVPPGEQSKSRATKDALEDFLLEQACNRDTCLLALGGGVVGDLVGYVAATFMRGIPVIQIPTTLLAMVDSSIGGKTAIDTPHGKNLIGAFWQPKRIYMDISFLSTLPQREFVNGMAEVIKTAAIWNAADFERLEKDVDLVRKSVQEAQHSHAATYLLQIILASVNVKAHVVTSDEREGGLRGLLNFGHTLGHAFEKILSPDWLHGECVSVGLVAEAQLACDLNHCDQQAVERLRNCLAAYGLPVAFDSATRQRLPLQDVMDTMKVDKKNQDARKKIVLLSSIGTTLEKKATTVDDQSIEDILTRHVGLTAGPPPPDHVTTAKELFKAPLVITTSPDCIGVNDKIAWKLTNEYQYTLSGGMDKLAEEKSMFCCVVYDYEFELKSLSTNVPSFCFRFPQVAGTSPLDLWPGMYECPVPERLGEDKQAKNGFDFLERMVRGPRFVPAGEKASCFITPTVPDYNEVSSSLMKQWIEGADAIEFRVDLLDKTIDTISAVGDQLATFRTLLPPSFPIIFTVRTFPQAGQFDPAKKQLYLDLIRWAHCWGCEYVDIEFTTLTEAELENIFAINKYYKSKLIASFHDPQGLIQWNSSEMQTIYDRAKTLFTTHQHQGIIKLVGFAHSFYDNILLENFRQQVDPEDDGEIILINMGEHGGFSRAVNRFLSPATHPCLPYKAAPGQLTVQQMTALKYELGLRF